MEPRSPISPFWHRRRGLPTMEDDNGRAPAVYSWQRRWWIGFATQDVIAWLDRPTETKSGGRSSVACRGEKQCLACAAQRDEVCKKVYGTPCCITRRGLVGVPLPSHKSTAHVGPKPALHRAHGRLPGRGFSEREPGWLSSGSCARRYPRRLQGRAEEAPHMRPGNPWLELRHG